MTNEPTSQVPDPRDAKIAELRKLAEDAVKHGLLEPHEPTCQWWWGLNLPCNCRAAEILAERLRAAAEGE